MQYSLKKIAEITGGTLRGDEHQIIEEVLIDSRKRINPVGTIFCAIKGKQHDGHNYIRGLYSKGITNFIAEYIPDGGLPDDANIVVVSDVLKALQKLAAYHRNEFTFPVVGITGSNGKTIVKEWCYQLLYRQFNVVRNPRSYNSQIGVPLSVLGIKTTDNAGLFEAGISQPGEMEKLESILKPTLGIFTNIGDAHASGFQNETEKVYEKLKLFKGVNGLIYRKEETLLTDILDRFVEENKIIPYTWSDSGPAFLRVTKKEIIGDSIRVVAESGGKKCDAVLPFSDESSYENAMHAWVLALVLKVDQRLITKGLAELQPIEMRLNQKAGKNNCVLISDFYNADFTSIEIVLDWADRRHSHKRKTMVLSDLEQSRLSDRDLYTQINSLLKKYQYDRLIGIGPHISECSFLFDLPDQAFYDTTEAFIKSGKSAEFKDEAVVLKGARSFTFEHIEKHLQMQVHNTVLEVNLNALQNNLDYYRSVIQENTRIMVMVKAFSYGSGGNEIAHFLQFNKVDYLGVAYADEGVELRRKGIHLPIMVMNSDEDSFDTMLDYDLEPELYSFRSLQLFAQSVHRKAIGEAKAHLEINTGMNRLGFDPSDLDQILDFLHDEPGIRIQSVFSHLAASEDPKLDDLTHKQIKQFDDFYEAFSRRQGYRPIKHIVNSGGVVRFPHAQFDMIRLGIGLYGFQPADSIAHTIEPVSTLKSFISQIRDVPPGEGIGYGNLDASDKARKIAIVAIGYADGLNRALSQGKGYFLVGGREAPIVGNICMDMTMCDVSHIACSEGDEVVVFGHKPRIEELASAIGTIPYEVLTSVSQRVKRVYSQE